MEPRPSRAPVHARGGAPAPIPPIDTANETPGPRPHGGDPGRAIPWLVLAAALALTLAATLFVALSTRERDEARFSNAVQSAQDRIAARLDTYIALLRGGTALFAASDTVTRAEFRDYAARLRVRDFTPGVQGIGFSARVPPGALRAVEAAQRAGDFPDFRVWPRGPRAEYHAIIFLEPLDARNRAAIGYDMSTEPARREAMERARDTGRAALSGRVTLVQEIMGPVQPGFLIYVAVYDGARVPETVEGRRRALRGFVYAPFRAQDLFARIFGSEALPRVTFRVYDGEGVGPDRLLYDSGEGEATEPRLTTTLEIGGRPWTLAYAPTHAFQQASAGWLVPGVAGSGLVVSALLFGLARAQVGARRRSEELVAALQGQKAALQDQYAAARTLNRELEVANAELERARAEAEHANRAKAEFLTAMSHELRTPLNAIAGYAELIELEIYGPVTGQQKDAVVKIQRSERYLLALINDILNYARLEAGKVEFRRLPVPLAAVLDDLRVMTEPQMRAKGLDGVFDPCGPAARAWGDEDKVRQVLLNLLSNAIKFTGRDGEIRVGCAALPEHVEIRVSDSGRGIPASKLESVFDPFMQVDRAAVQTSQQGIGLGLAISRDLARGMHGDLVAHSTEGVGSTFVLTLPRAPDEPPRR